LGSAPGSPGEAERGTSFVDELRALAILAAQWTLGRPGIYALPLALPWLHLGDTVYRKAAPPRPISRVTCASVEALWAAAEVEAGVRRANGAALMQALGSNTQVRPVQVHSAATPGFLRFPVRLPRGLAGFTDPRRAKQLGITRAYPSVLAALPSIRPLLDNAANRWPGAEELARTLFTVPTHSRLRASERAELIRLLLEYQP
jgi:hypothetical protein